MRSLDEIVKFFWLSWPDHGLRCVLAHGLWYFQIIHEIYWAVISRPGSMTCDVLVPANMSSSVSWAWKHVWYRFPGPRFGNWSSKMTQNPKKKSIRVCEPLYRQCCSGEYVLHSLVAQWEKFILSSSIAIIQSCFRQTTAPANSLLDLSASF